MLLANTHSQPYILFLLLALGTWLNGCAGLGQTFTEKDTHSVRRGHWIDQLQEALVSEKARQIEQRLKRDPAGDWDAFHLTDQE